MAKYHRIVVIGAQNVGKTTLINSFLNNQFNEEYVPTIEDTYSVEDQKLENQHFIDIIDTGGIDLFPNVQDHWLRDGQTFILVYSVACQDSFRALNGVKEDLITLEMTDTPVVVVANKFDLTDQAVIDAKEGRELSRSFTDSFFVEASAKLKFNVQVVFQHAIRRIHEKVLEGLSDVSPTKKHKCVMF